MAFTIADIERLHRERVTRNPLASKKALDLDYAEKVLALTLIGEGATESVLGRTAIGWTVQNRALQSRRSVPSICFQKWQYSCWMPQGGAENHARLMDLAEKVFSTRESLGTYAPLFRESEYLACGIISGVLRDPTKGSTHYLTTALLKSNPPVWTEGQRPAVVIGAHTFYAGIAWNQKG